MTTVFDDTFGGGSVQAISARAPDVGTGWTRHPSYTGTTISDLGTGFATMDSTGSAVNVLYQTEVLSSADATITATFKRDPASVGGASIGLGLRGNTSDLACYRAYYNAVDGKFHLYRVGGGGALTELGGTGFSLVWSLGASHTFTLGAVGSALEVTVDGTSRITATDATITTAGRAGYYCQKTGTGAFDYWADRYTVDVSAAASFNPAFLGRALRGGFHNLGD